MQVDFEKIIELLSPDKFEACRLQGEKDEVVLARYKWNMALAEAFYPSLHALEVGFRNRIHQCIANVCGPDWLETAKFLYEDEKEMIDAAKRALQVRRVQKTTGYLISELNFGFWISLADVRYETMWPKIIRSVFPSMPATIRTRIEISKRLNRVRRLRNAVSHHHSIWHWQDLGDHHENIYTLMGWIHPVYAKRIGTHDRFVKILADGHTGFNLP